MRIREYTSADLGALRRLHAAQGFGYAFPDLESPLFVTKLILEDEAGEDRNESWEIGEREAGEKKAAEKEAGSREEGLGNPPARKKIAHGNSPRILMAILLRLTAETYFLHDPSAGTPRERWQRLQALHEVARQQAAASGLDDVQAFLPPQVARPFGRRLERLGWTRDPWPCFSRRVP